jgi:translation initiation factor 2 alpha subunit (eIF-2alpha)
MITTNDLNRILDSKNIKRIDNALKACKNSESQWAKDFWSNVWKKLSQKYNHLENNISKTLKEAENK